LLVGDLSSFVLAFDVFVSKTSIYRRVDKKN
jgi:hypothetical protein